MPPLMQRLRSETAPHHAAIEQRVHVLDADADAATYRNYLGVLLGFHRPLEARLRSAGGLDDFFRDFTPTWKSPALASDLRALGVDDAAVAAMPDCEGVPAPRSATFALGCMYVLEGATLGGRLIYRELSARMPDEIARASQYLCVYGDTGAAWRTFTTALHRHAGDEARHAEVIAGATATFTSLLSWLES